MKWNQFRDPVFHLCTVYDPDRVMAADKFTLIK